jgi:5-methylcytosine-specific restriction endonuclease McrA
MARPKTYTFEDLKEAVSKSEKLNEVLKILGLTGASARFRVKTHIMKCGIDTSHWESEEKNKREYLSRDRLKLPASQYLSKDRKVRSATLRAKCISEGLLDNVCYECGLCPEWEGNPLVLHLDHINGDKYDNRLENLRILCPNCHSQTDNYCNKNPMRYHKGENK